ncbi:MAG TPA: hypothetical protein VIQ54_28935 [Polyangia bacterium]
MPASTLKTTTSLSRLPFLPTLAVALAAAACDGASACPTNSTPVNGTIVECLSTVGSVQVASSTLSLPATAVPGVGATTCLAIDQTCSNESVTAFASASTIGEGGILFGIRIAPTDAPGTYPLAGDTPRFSSPLVSDGVSYTGDLTVTSGNLVIIRNDTRDLNATFAVELQTTDGQHQVSLTGGSLHISSCRVVTRTFCETAN